MDRLGRTLAIKNNTNEVVHNVTFQITYLNMAGKPLDYETFTKETDIDPGMTKQIDIPAYEYDRSYSYYKSQDSQISPHKFKIKFGSSDKSCDFVIMQIEKS